MSDECRELDHHMSKAACERVIQQKAKISLPLSIQPYAIAGTIKTKCIGHPTVKKREGKNTCSLLITQEICIDIPVQFGAMTETNEPFIDCDHPSIEDCEK